MERKLSERLKELRNESGLSYAQLSKVTGLSRSELCR